MGKVFSVVAKFSRFPAQRFNVENRAHRVISQDKPKPAPKFEANLKDLERVLRDHPEIVEQAGKKDSALDDRLKQVFVSSSDYLEQRRIINPEKPLPLSRKQVGEFEYGFQEPDPNKVSKGKCTLRQAVQFISDHQENPDQWTAEKVAKEFELKQERVNDILEHFRMFSVHIPKKEGNTKQVLIDPFRLKQNAADYNKILEGSKKLP